MVENVEVKKRSQRTVRELLYTSISDVERKNGVQVKQNDSKIEALVTEIMKQTRNKPFYSFYSLLYSELALFMESIDDAIKNKTIGMDSYVLAINA